MAVAVQDVRIAHDELASMTEHLIGEYEDVVPAGSVIRLVARTVQGLRQDGVPPVQLARRAEPLVREQLDGRVAGAPGAGHRGAST
jgi:hypothetical protein